MIECVKLNKQFRNGPVLSDFCAAFESGDHYCITGASGCGKTTLLRIIGGLEKPDSGQVRFSEKPEFSWVFQENRLLEQKTAVENIRWASPSRTEEECLLLLLQMGLPADAANQPIRDYSGGMKRRVALARCLLYPATVFLLDEPLKGLDPETKTRVQAVLDNRTQGKTVLMISHEPILPDGYTEVRLPNRKPT